MTEPFVLSSTAWYSVIPSTDAPWYLTLRLALLLARNGTSGWTVRWRAAERGPCGRGPGAEAARAGPAATRLAMTSMAAVRTDQRRLPLQPSVACAGSMPCSLPVGVPVGGGP